MAEFSAETGLNASTGKPAPKPNAMSRLGRGLGSLIPPAPTQPVVPAVRTITTTSGTTKASLAVTSLKSSDGEQAVNPIVGQGVGGLGEIQLSSIARNARQPREKFDDRALQALSESIAQHGLIQPVVVRKLSVPRGTLQYELIAGERRLRAFESLGKRTIPAVLHQADEATSGVLALIENIQREDLNPIERASAIKKLMGEFAWTQQQVGEKVGLDRATVANLLRLNDLDPFVSACVREGKLTQGHAKALLAIEDVRARRAVAERSLHDEWSVRQVEREVQRLKTATGVSETPLSKLAPRVQVQLSDLERRLGRHLGTKVSIAKGKKNGSGRLTIDFYNLDQFDGLLARLGFNPNSLND